MKNLPSQAAWLHGFIGENGKRSATIPLLALKGNDDYMMGVFLVGAYQETLGDHHNLPGDTSVVTVRLRGGKLSYTRQPEGDTAGDVLSYLEYVPRDLLKRFKTLTEEPATQKKINEDQAAALYKAYRKNLKSYTYFSG